MPVIVRGARRDLRHKLDHRLCHSTESLVQCLCTGVGGMTVIQKPQRKKPLALRTG